MCQINASTPPPHFFEFRFQHWKIHVNKFEKRRAYDTIVEWKPVSLLCLILQTLFNSFPSRVKKKDLNERKDILA